MSGRRLLYSHFPTDWFDTLSYKKGIAFLPKVDGRRSGSHLHYRKSMVYFGGVREWAGDESRAPVTVCGITVIACSTTRCIR